MAQDAPAAGKDGQEAAGHPDVIVVTARRQAEVLVEVPATVSVIDGAQLRDQGISNIREIVGLVPNAVIQDSASNLNTFINIRGMQLVNTQAEPNVGVYRNGLYAGGHRQSLGAQVDIERVEVLRGPQGGFYGRSSLGGTVDIIATMPKPEFGGYVRASYGSYRRSELEGAINIPLSDSVAFRVTGWHFDQNRSEMKNATLNEYIGKSTDKGIRGSVRANLSDRLKVDLFAEYQEYKGPSLISFAPNGIIGNGLTFQPSKPETFSQVFRDTPSTSNRSNAYFFVKTDYDAGFATLSLNGSYREYRFRATYDLDQTDLGPPYNIRGVASPRDKVEDTYLEALITSHSDGPFTWMLGASYFKEDYAYDVSNSFILNVDAVTGLPLGLGVQTVPVGGPKPGTTISTDSKSVFATASFDISDKLTLSGGLRYNSDKKRLTFLSGIMPISDPTLAFVANSAFSSIFPTYSLSSSARFNFTAPSVTLRYMPTENLNFYATYGTGFRPGAFNLTPVSADTVPYDEETARNFEVGFRANLLSGKLAISGAAFYMPQDNVLITQSTPLAQSYYSNAGTSKTKGLELELLTRPASWLSGGVSLGLLDARFDKATVNAGTPGAFMLDDKLLPYTRRGSVNAMINIDAPVSGRVDFVANGTARFEWGGMLGDYVGINQPYPAYHKIDLQAGLQFNDKTRLTVGVKNLLDEHVPQFYFYNGAQTVTGGRTFSIDATHRF
jgi:iron complex outermembrane receptor protein